MRFELTEALIDQILFSMEDQNLDHVVDTFAGIVSESPDGEAGPEDRFISLPEWVSADGFRLMESFTAALRNPIVREELTGALDRGRGVFRAFKDVLSRHPEIERLWFSFKEKEMRRRIFEWFNALREEWGLERIGDEPEETEDLVLEDFRFRAALPEDEEALREIHDLCGAARAGRWLDPSASMLGPFDSGDRAAIAVDTARGELAAFALIAYDGAVARTLALDVRPEYRGLGIGEKLLDSVAAAAMAKGADSLLFDLPSDSEPFSRVLNREGYEIYLTRFRLDLGRRRKESM